VDWRASRLNLIDSKRFKCGAVALRYRRG